MANIVPVTISDALFYKTDPVFQYNEGDQLLVMEGITLPASYRVDFSNHIDNYMAYTVTGDADGAVIPPEILANGNTIYAFYVDESGDTVTTQYRIEIPVIRRPMPEDYVPSPSSHGIINQLTQDVGDLKSDLGDLDDLETTDKSSIVAAINEAAQSGGGGVTADIKVALLDCFSHVAWIDEHGQDYYDALETALYPPTNLLGITAVFNSGGTTIYNTATVDDLKQYLTVTAIYDDSSSEVVTNYALSGTVETGNCDFTVTYGGKTATFRVNIAEWLTSITATYTQSGTVYDSDTLDSLKSDLVVRAYYSDTTSEVITNYTLSGTLAEGTSVVTVSYGGKTATFTVTVSALNYLYRLPAETTFDGTSDYIDTELQLYKTDIDFTILGHAQYTRFANSYNVLMHCMHEVSPWNGSLIDHPVAGLRFAWGSNQSQISGSTYPLDVKFAITHVANTNTYTIHRKMSSESETATATVSWNFVSIDETLILGAYQDINGNKDRYFAGTIYDFSIIDDVVESDYINDYLGGEING